VAGGGRVLPFPRLQGQRCLPSNAALDAFSGYSSSSASLLTHSACGQLELVREAWGRYSGTAAGRKTSLTAILFPQPVEMKTTSWAGLGCTTLASLLPAWFGGHICQYAETTAGHSCRVSAAPYPEHASRRRQITCPRHVKPHQPVFSMYQRSIFSTFFMFIMFSLVPVATTRPQDNRRDRRPMRSGENQRCRRRAPPPQ